MHARPAGYLPADRGPRGAPARAGRSPRSRNSPAFHADQVQTSLMSLHNEKDHTIRIREYFDHYLKGGAGAGVDSDRHPPIKTEERRRNPQKKEKIAS